MNPSIAGQGTGLDPGLGPWLGAVGGAPEATDH